MEHCLLVLAWLRNDFFDVLLYVQQERERPIVRQVRRGPVAVSRTNSAAKQIELKIGAFPMCLNLSTPVPRRTLPSNFQVISMATKPAGKRFWFGVSVVLKGDVLRSWLARDRLARRANCHLLDQEPQKLAGTEHLSKCFRISCLSVDAGSQIRKESRSEHYQTFIKMNAKAPWRTV